MDAVNRLANRLVHLKAGLTSEQAHEVAGYIYGWLPDQLLGMKEAAKRMGLASSNTLTMRMARGHPLLIVATVAKNRLTTADAVDAYLEMHPQPSPNGDDVLREAS
jgi:hypothetical protein